MQDDRFLRGLKELIKSLIISLVIMILLTQLVVSPVRVEGLSMYPNLKDSEIGISNIFAGKFMNIKRFDIVVVYMPEQEKYLVKRVIGLPNETIEYKGENLYINNELISEDFLDTEHKQKYLDQNQEFTYDLSPIQLGDDEYFLMGDNRPTSIDSRYYGSFNRKNIVSKNIFIIYPLNRIRGVR